LIERHVARHLAPATLVIHEVRSEIVHLDVHLVPPGAERPFWFLFTTGMSALPMRVPPGMGLVPHAELSLMLPAYWKVDREVWKREPRWYWPVRELLSAARYPHRNKTWFGAGHTFANGEPPRRFDPTTRMSSMVMLASELLDEEHPVIDAEVPTVLLELWPLHSDELALARRQGSHALFHRLLEGEVSAVLDPDRPSCVAGQSGASAHT